MLPLLEEAREKGQWVVLVGHEIGEKGPETTRAGMLDALLSWAENPANEVWLAPVETIARYVRERRRDG